MLAKEKPSVLTLPFVIWRGETVDLIFVPFPLSVPFKVAVSLKSWMDPVSSGWFVALPPLIICPYFGEDSIHNDLKSLSLEGLLKLVNLNF